MHKGIWQIQIMESDLAGSWLNFKLAYIPDSSFAFLIVSISTGSTAPAITAFIGISRLFRGIRSQNFLRWEIEGAQYSKALITRRTEPI